MRVIRDLTDVQIVLRELLDWKGQMESRNYSRRGLQIKEVGAATDATDVVILQQLNESLASVRAEFGKRADDLQKQIDAIVQKL